MTTPNVFAVASAARSKFGREADRADLQLRLLVGHANLLDCLAVDLEETEQETLLRDEPHDSKPPGDTGSREPMRWADIITHLFQGDSDSDSDSDGEHHREEGEETGEDDEHDQEHTLLRWPSNRLRSLQPKLYSTRHHQPSINHVVDQMPKPRRPKYLKRLTTIAEDAEVFNREQLVIDPAFIKDILPELISDDSSPSLPLQAECTPTQMVQEALISSVIQEKMSETQLPSCSIDPPQAQIIAVT